MMNKRLLIWGGITLGFFALGLSWGFWSREKEITSLSNGRPLRILCEEGWLNEDLLNRFAQKYKVRVLHWTYSNPNEFLRQMANSNGKIDVICTNSVLLQSLVSSKWIRKWDYASLPNSRHISVDFFNLPYDPKSEYSVPIFWNLYGFFGKGTDPSATVKQTIQSKKVSIWGEELNMIHLLSHNGVHIDERLNDAENKSLELDIQRFLKSLARVELPVTAEISAEAITSKVDWIQIPLAQVARLLGETSPYHFWLPSDGGAVSVGVFAIGELSENPELAARLINELISTESALEIHKRMGAAVVHTTLDYMDSIAPLQKASSIRRFPLTQYTFPNISLDVIPRFQKYYSKLSSEN
ncbi:MAG: hypothetical protein AB7F86_00475 [Bdellovibrionales bacterium]